MEISGLIKTSLIDYPGQLSAVVFTQGCNFACGFCHNPDLVKTGKGNIDEDNVLSFFAARVGKIDGVVITGGEPTIQPELIDFVAKIKSLGLRIKIDTNGSNPKIVQELIEKKLVDYVACDIKGRYSDYPKIAKYLNTKVVQETVAILLKGKVDYEFRTTVLPYYHHIEDFEEIGEMIKGAKKYTIQGFRNQLTLDKKLQKVIPFSEKDLTKVAKKMKKYVDEVIIHRNI